LTLQDNQKVLGRFEPFIIVMSFQSYVHETLNAFGPPIFIPSGATIQRDKQVLPITATESHA
jgi:hypothetical protein